MALSIFFPPECSPRTRSRFPVGYSSSSSSTWIAPEISVPVTTLPNPFIAKDRSTGSRCNRLASLAGTDCANRARFSFSVSNPAFVRALTGIMGASCKNDRRTKSSTSSLTNPNTSASTRSDLVITTIPREVPSSRQMSKCSLVCGLIDSSAAITSITRSMPPTPASMLRTNRSCPGTSTNPIRISPSSRNAKPRSIVIPRRFSSASRSGSVPVNAFTSDDLP